MHGGQEAWQRDDAAAGPGRPGSRNSGRVANPRPCWGWLAPQQGIGSHRPWTIGTVVVVVLHTHNHKHARANTWHREQTQRWAIADRADCTAATSHKGYTAAAAAHGNASSSSMAPLLYSFSQCVPCAVML
eukprot:361235-Chlamydomonas_euryale.AAC.3